MPDPGFIEERREALVGIVLTHAHEDHLGAVADLWPRLKAPVYATPFAASVLRRKLTEAGLVDAVPVTEIPLGGKFSPAAVRARDDHHDAFDPRAQCAGDPHQARHGVPHRATGRSIPSRCWARVTDEAMLRRIGDEGALAMVCDSTNVFVEGEAGSEATVRANLEKLVTGRQGPGRHHLLCLQPGARSRARRWRRWRPAAIPVLSGRALQRMVEAAQECGYLLDFPQCIAEQQAGYLPRDKVLFICTGSQGETARLDGQAAPTAMHRDLRARDGRHGDLLLARHPRQRTLGGTAAQRADGRAASRSSPTARPISTSRAIRRATSWCGSISGCDRRSPCRSMARSAT